PGGAESFNGDDAPTLQGADRGDAGVDGRALDHHRAGATLTQAAAELGTIQRELTAQHVKERRLGVHIELMGIAIDRQRDHWFSDSGFLAVMAYSHGTRKDDGIWNDDLPSFFRRHDRRTGLYVKCKTYGNRADTQQLDQIRGLKGRSDYRDRDQETEHGDARVNESCHQERHALVGEPPQRDAARERLGERCHREEQDKNRDPQDNVRQQRNDSIEDFGTGIPRHRKIDFQRASYS